MNERDAENTIFDLRKKIDAHLRAGNVAEVSRLQIEISQLQQKHITAVTGVGKDENYARTA